MPERDGALIGARNDPSLPKIAVKRFEMQPKCLHDMHEHDEAPSRLGFYHVPKGQHIMKTPHQTLDSDSAIGRPAVSRRKDHKLDC